MSRAHSASNGRIFANALNGDVGVPLAVAFCHDVRISPRCFDMMNTMFECEMMWAGAMMWAYAVENAINVVSKAREKFPQNKDLASLAKAMNLG